VTQLASASARSLALTALQPLEVAVLRERVGDHHPEVGRRRLVGDLLRGGPSLGSGHCRSLAHALEDRLDEAHFVLALRSLRPPGFSGLVLAALGATRAAPVHASRLKTAARGRIDAEVGELGVESGEALGQVGVLRAELGGSGLAAF